MEEYRLLNKIKSPNDVKSLKKEDLDELCLEIRKKLVETVSKNGGHLASNLGIVELTVAIHRAFNSPEDKIIWDVGHQSYVHKLLTGRYDSFSTIRTENGISGFCRPNESEHDITYTGHSSTSISTAYGLAKANSILGLKDRYCVAVIGDGALTGGLAYEGLNNAGKSNDNLIIIINDNKMSISKNVGAMSRYLSVVRSKPSYFKFKEGTENFLEKIPLVGKFMSKVASAVKSGIRHVLYPQTIFENMGYIYLGPIDGHNIEVVTGALESAKNRKRPVILHVSTVKGKGYSFAEDNPGDFHGISQFDIKTGSYSKSGDSYSDVFGKELCSMAEKDSRICAITAAMTSGTGLDGFSKKFRERFFDVGIAEEHAVTFASGLSKNGLVPVIAVYSTFLQRGYDQLIHDASLQGIKMVIALDRAGFVGEDGETHHGLFDVSYLNSLPNVTVYSPSGYEELKMYLGDAVYKCKGLCVVRYPRGVQDELPSYYTPTHDAFSVYGRHKAKIALVVFGRLFFHACKAAEILAKNGVNIKVVKLNRIKPIDIEAVRATLNCEKVFFFEECEKSGSVAESFSELLFEENFKGKYGIVAVCDKFVEQARMSTLLKRYGLDCDGMVKTILSQNEEHTNQ